MPQEVQRAVNACKSYGKLHGLDQLRFNTVQLQEPPKAQLLKHEAGLGPQPPRRVWCVVQHPPSRGVYDCVVELSSVHPRQDLVVTWEQLEGTHPMVTLDDVMEAEQVVKEDSRVKQLLRERYGVQDNSLLVVDCWAIHGPPEKYQDRRIVQGLLYMRTAPEDNEYAHPLDMVPIVDLDIKEVIHIDMSSKATKMPEGQYNYNRNMQVHLPWRNDLKPLHVVQPEGPSFQVAGNLVQWQGWQLRVGFTMREGLVLHQVGYMDKGQLRPVLHRASLVEMVVPYGDPRHPYTRKCALDVGDYGLGHCVNSLELGCDCLGHIKYFDACMVNARGEPVVVKNAVCMHEEDSGLLWKHYDMRLDHVEVRRGRRLVLSMIATFANYEYGMYWYFYQDGTISFELKLTGILSTSAHDGTAPSLLGTVVAPGVLASHHQHLFCMRIDPAVDDMEGGRNLVISEVNAEQLPLGPGNPCDNGFVVREEDLATIHQAMRMSSPETARYWKIKNPSVLHPVTGQPVAWKLVPQTNVPMMARPSSLVASRAFFATRHLFVTPHQDDQLYPSGNHVVSSTRCLGLREWTQEDKPLAGADPVLWYSFGITHIPRVEEWPIMPVEVVSFTMKPCNFFDMNPSLNIPPMKDKASREDQGMVVRVAEVASLAGPAPILRSKI